MQLKKSYNSEKLFINKSLIEEKIKKRIKSDNWEFIVSALPEGSMLVGGYIRDIILERLSLYPDIDIIVPKDALIIGKNIAKKFSGKFLVLDLERNIVRIIFSHCIVDIANQTDFLLFEDLKTRDFTINSISFSFDSKQLIDPVNGMRDLKNSLLKSFRYENLISDPLRILRCFRFVSELNFNIEPNLLDFIELNKNKLKTVSVERIQYELKKIVTGEQAMKAILYLNKIQIFDYIKSYENNNYKFLLTVNYENFTKKEVEKYVPIFYLTELLDIELVKEFKFSKFDTNRINTLREWRNKLTEKSIEHFSEFERFQLHRDLEKILPAFILYLPIRFHKYWLKRWRNKEDRLFHPRNFINGNTLKAMVGIDDGPLLGDLINYLSKEFAYDRLNNFDEAIYKAKHWFQQNAPKYD